MTVDFTAPQRVGRRRTPTAGTSATGRDEYRPEPRHTYTNAGTYTATLTVTDSSSPAKTASSSVTITASPINGTVPGAPTGLTATAGNGQVTLNWPAPAATAA